MIKKLLIAPLCLLLFVACKQGAEKWPSQITTTVNLLIPEKSKELKYYQLQGTYQAKYETIVCWPAEQFINTLADRMKKHGWKRLEEDSLNPGLKHSWTLKGKIFEQWSNYSKEDTAFSQWNEEWEDNNKNLVLYVLKYTTEKRGYITITSGDCNLNVVIIYIPKKIRPTPAEIELLHKNSKLK